MTNKTQMIAALQQAFALAFEGAKVEAMALSNDVAFLTKHAVKGRVPSGIEKSYKAGVVAERLAMPFNEETRLAVMALFERGAKRDKEQSNAILAANNRYSRRLKAGGLQGADNRGTGTKPPKAKATPAAKPDNAKAIKADIDADKAQISTARPILVNEAEVMAYLGNIAAELRATQRKNAKAFTARTRAVVKAFLDAEKEAFAPKEK